MKIELKNVKYAAFASQETSCFSATVYLNGKKSGQVDNDGHGGSNRYYPHSLEAMLDAYAKTLPDIVSKYAENDDGSPLTYTPDADCVIDDAFNAYMLARDLKRLLAGKILMVKGGKLAATKKIAPDRLAVILSDPAKLLAVHKATAILNVLPFDEAMALYVKHG